MMGNNNYLTVDNLDARIDIHQTYSVSNVGWFNWFISEVQIPTGAKVLELGSGMGTLWKYVDPKLISSIKLTVSDESPAMCDELDRMFDSYANVHVKKINISEDIELPFLPDILICNHVLYHVENNVAAIRKIHDQLNLGKKRCRCFFGTNSYYSMNELSLFLPERFGNYPMGDMISSFTLESGCKQIFNEFGAAFSHMFHDTLSIDAAAPIVNYINSMPLQLSSEEKDEIELKVKAYFGEHNTLEIYKTTGYITNDINQSH